MGLSAAIEIEVAGPPVSYIQAKNGVSFDFGNGALVKAGDPMSAVNTVYGSSLIANAQLLPDGGRDKDSLGPNLIFEQQISQVGISSRNSALLLQSGNMAAPLQALHKCVEDMFTGWGVTPATRDILAHEPAVIDAQGLAKTFDQSYPKALESPGRSDRFTFRVVVDAQGIAHRCHIIQSTQETVNELLCKSVLKMRFTPAQDKNGTPVSWYFYGAINHRPNY